MGHNRRAIPILILVAILVSPGVFSISPAAGHGTLDQSSLTSSFPFPIDSVQGSGQSFIAGATGNLDAVDIHLFPCTGPNNWTVNIWQGPFGATISTGAGGIISTTNYPIPTGGNSVEHVDLTVPTPVSAGITYAIEITSNNGCAWLVDTSNPYRGGNAFPNGFVNAGADFTFATFVSTAAGVDADLDGHDSIATGGDDCDDLNAAIHPGAFDIPDNGIDEDCDGKDATTGPIDNDGDGFSPPEDCNDNDASINPGAAEIAGNDVDENCDGIIEPAPPVDNDGDGFSPPEDCDDSNAAVNPGADEVAGNGIDDNCNGEIDESTEPPEDEKKSCKALKKAQENGNGKHKGLEKALANNGCS